MPEELFALRGVARRLVARQPPGNRRDQPPLSRLPPASAAPGGQRRNQHKPLFSFRKRGARPGREIPASWPPAGKDPRQWSKPQFAWEIPIAKWADASPRLASPSVACAWPCMIFTPPQTTDAVRSAEGHCGRRSGFARVGARDAHPYVIRCQSSVLGAWCSIHNYCQLYQMIRWNTKRRGLEHGYPVVFRDCRQTKDLRWFCSSIGVVSRHPLHRGSPLALHRGAPCGGPAGSWFATTCCCRG